MSEWGWVRHDSLRGHTFYVWENLDVPRIPYSMLRSSVYLYATVNDAMEGVRLGGSGFLVGYPLLRAAGRFHIYVVTNDHVTRRGGVVRVNTRGGEKDVLTIDPDAWLRHPEGDDISAAAVSISDDLDVSFISTAHFATQEQLRLWQVGPGDEVYMVGRFINHEGHQRNLPTARFGNIAMMPYEKIRHETGLLVDAFLVEMHSLSGYSGSPVLLPPPIDRGVVAVTDGRVQHRFETALLGIDFGHSYLPESVRDVAGNVIKPEMHVRGNTGIAHVAPAWKVLDVLDRDEFKNQRQRVEEKFYREHLTDSTSESD